MLIKHEGKVTKKFIDKELKAGSLFVQEKYLTELPLDWIDCVIFLCTDGWKSTIESRFVLIMDDKLTEKVFSFTAKENIKLFILNPEKHKLWSVLLTKEKNQETQENERVFLGGENLREFCDERNIYYRSIKSDDGALLSGTNLMWQKNPNEDCRVPMN